MLVWGLISVGFLHLASESGLLVLHGYRLSVIHLLYASLFFASVLCLGGRRLYLLSSLGYFVCPCRIVLVCVGH